MRRLTLSLPDDILEMTDRLAREASRSRSGFVQDVLSEFLSARRLQKLQRDLAEGYREMAEESVDLTRDFAVSENELWRTQQGEGDDDLDG